MVSPRYLLLAAVATSSLFVGGCSTTLVQYLPQGDVTTCDASWPGLWKGTSPTAENPSTGRGWKSAPIANS